MSIIIESILSHDSLSGELDKTDFIAANQSSIQTITTNVRSETYFMPETIDSLDFPRFFIQSFANSAFTGKVQDNRTVHTNKSGGWGDDVRAGDTFVIALTLTSNGTGTILEVSEDGQTLITDKVFPSLETFPLGSYFAITTPKTAMEYMFNFIPNDASENYISLVDGDTQRALVDGLDNTDLVTVHTMDLKGFKSWQFGSITVKGNGIGNGDPAVAAGVIQAFTITHRTVISPLVLFEEWDDVLARIAPERLLGGNSMKYINSIALSEEVNNPNDVITATENEMIGNIGWFNQNLNGGDKFYSIENLVYRRLDNTITDSLQLTTLETKINFDIVNTENAPFSNNNTKFIFGFNYAPADQDQYRNNPLANANTMDYNFVFDSVVSTLGQASGTPEQDGTDSSVIKSFVVTIVDGTRASAEVRVEMDAAVVGRIAPNPTQRFESYVETGDHNLIRANTDKENSLIDANDFFLDNSDPTMFSQNQRFLEHPFTNVVTETVVFVDARKEDDLLGINDLVFDRNGREDDDIIMTGIEGAVIMQKDTGATFVLDRRFFELSGIKRVDGLTTPEINTPRGYKTPVDENRGNIKFFRLFTDIGGFIDYRFQFPFVMEWMDFLPLPAANDDFFVNTEPNNGLNRDWVRYPTFLGWDMFFRTTLSVTKNGNPLSFPKEDKILAYDYNDGPEWNATVVRTYDETDALISSSGSPVVIKYANGRIEAEFNFIGLTTPIIPDLVIVLRIDIFEEGTQKSTYYISSAYDAHPNTWWFSVDASKRVKITNPSANKFIGEAMLIGALLPADKLEFKITPRLYDLRAAEPPGPPAVPKLKEDGTPKEKDGSAQFKIKE